MKFTLALLCLLGICIAAEPAFEVYVPNAQHEGVQVNVPEPAEPLVLVYSVGDVVVPGVHFRYLQGQSYRELVVIHTDFIHCMIGDDGFKTCTVLADDEGSPAKLLAVDVRRKIAILDVLTEGSHEITALDQANFQHYLDHVNRYCAVADVERLVRLAIKEETKLAFK